MSNPRLLAETKARFHNSDMKKKKRTTYPGIARRLTHVMKRDEVRVSTLAERLGKTPQAVYDWMKKGTISREVVPKLCAELGISEGWLLTGRPEPIANKKNTGHENLGRSSLPLFHVPLISWTKAGEWGEVVDLFEPGDAEEWVSTNRNVGPKTFCLRVEGDSMENPNGRPTYPDGCKIIVDPDVAVTNGARVVARYGGSQTFKQYIEDGGKVYLKPLNPRYPVIEANDSMEIIGCVVQTILDE